MEKDKEMEIILSVLVYSMCFLKQMAKWSVNSLVVVQKVFPYEGHVHFANGWNQIKENKEMKSVTSYITGYH